MTTQTKKESDRTLRSRPKSSLPTTNMCHSSKDSPCPVCDRTKDKDCSWSEDKGLVLCYTEGKDGSPAQTASGYHFTGKYSDSYHGVNTCAQYTKRKPGHNHSNHKPVQRLKSASQKDRAATLAAAEVEAHVMHLATMVVEGSQKPAQAHNELAAWCKEHGHNEYSASQLLKEQLQGVREQGVEIASDEAPRLLREYRLIERQFGDRLKFNELTKEIELDSETFDPTTTKLEMGVTHNVVLKGSREDLTDSVVKIARQNSYSPVGEYLRKVHQLHGNSTAIIEDVAARHLGATEPIHQVLIKRFLIGAVARAIAPGCKHDCALILQGPQGYFKSTFFKVLASEPWFDDSLGSASDKDEKLKLHRSWMIEWAELETAFKRKDVSQIKALMSSSVDILRPPYGRGIESLKRPSVIVGTTNKDQFLADPTGNRRFWVVPITQSLDLSQLRKERDQIWAAAVALYQAGEQWWLTKEENQAVDIDRAQYESEDAWLEPISDYVDGFQTVTIKAVLTNAIEMDIARRNSGHFQRVANILKRLGWEKLPNAVSHNGKKQKVWKRKISQSC